MYSIQNNTTNTIIIKKSKFIIYLYKVTTIDEINGYLNAVNTKYKDSTHICYAYIVNGKEKANDDGEPGGTAGIPILTTLKRNKLTNILAVVIRYFGGVKLGAKGLVRAYSNCISDTLKLTNIIELDYGYLVQIEFKHENIKLIDYMLSNKRIINKSYNESIIYSFYLSEKELDFASSLEKCCIHVSIKDKILIDKNII